MIVVQRIPFRHAGTAEDIRILKNQLTLLFQACPPIPRGELVVWNLACGRADETGALAAALKPAMIRHYTGIDLRGHCIREARQRWSMNTAAIEFIEGDASALPLGNGPATPDVIMIRHQNYWHEPAIWDRIFTRALNCLADDGILVCTSYFDREHEMMKSAMQSLGATQLVDFKNPSSRRLNDAPGKSVDRHLVAFSITCRS